MVAFFLLLCFLTVNNDQKLLSILKRKNNQIPENYSQSKCTKVIKIDLFLNESTLPAVLARMTACDGLPFKIFIISKDLRKYLISLGHSLRRSVTTSREQVFKNGAHVS